MRLESLDLLVPLDLVLLVLPDLRGLAVLPVRLVPLDLRGLPVLV